MSSFDTTNSSKPSSSLFSHPAAHAPLDVNVSAIPPATNAPVLHAATENPFPVGLLAIPGIDKEQKQDDIPTTHLLEHDVRKVSAEVACLRRSKFLKPSPFDLDANPNKFPKQFIFELAPIAIETSSSSTAELSSSSLSESSQPSSSSSAAAVGSSSSVAALKASDAFFDNFRSEYCRRVALIHRNVLFVRTAMYFLAVVHTLCLLSVLICLILAIISAQGNLGLSNLVAAVGIPIPFVVSVLLQCCFLPVITKLANERLQSAALPCAFSLCTQDWMAALHEQMPEKPHWHWHADVIYYVNATTGRLEAELQLTQRGSDCEMTEEEKERQESDKQMAITAAAGPITAATIHVPQQQEEQQQHEHQHEEQQEHDHEQQQEEQVQEEDGQGVEDASGDSLP